MVLDLSGRPYLGYDLQIPAQRIGNLDTELIEHFFQVCAHVVFYACLYMGVVWCAVTHVSPQCMSTVSMCKPMTWCNKQLSYPWVDLMCHPWVLSCCFQALLLDISIYALVLA